MGRQNDENVEHTYVHVFQTTGPRHTVVFRREINKNETEVGTDLIQ